MRCAERNWALICHAGSAPEASIGSKPLGSELADVRASLAPESDRLKPLNSSGESEPIGILPMTKAPPPPVPRITEKHLSQLPALHAPSAFTAGCILHKARGRACGRVRNLFSLGRPQVGRLPDTLYETS